MFGIINTVFQVRSLLLLRTRLTFSVQRIGDIPNVYKMLQGTVIECNEHFKSVVQAASATFTTANARRVLDNWMNLVVEAMVEMSIFHKQSVLSEPFASSYADIDLIMIKSSCLKSFSPQGRIASFHYDESSTCTSI